MQLDDNEIDTLCNDCSDLLTTIDAINANLMQWYMKWDDKAKKAVKDLDTLIRHGLEKVRSIGMSVTPKWTLMEDHCVKNQVRWIKEGLGGARFFDESYVEVAHKDAKVLDRRVEGVQRFEDKQHAQLKMEERSNNPQIDAEREHNNRVPKKRARLKGDAQQQVKKERRCEKIAEAAEEQQIALDGNAEEDSN